NVQVVWLNSGVRSRFSRRSLWRGKIPADREYGSRTKVFLTPVPQKNQRRRNCVKPSALGDEHGKRNAFPRNFVSALIIQKFQRLHKLETGYATVEQKAGHTEGAAPSEKRIKRRNRA